MGEFFFTLDPSNSSSTDAHSTSVVYGYYLRSDDTDAVVEKLTSSGWESKDILNVMRESEGIEILPQI